MQHAGEPRLFLVLGPHRLARRAPRSRSLQQYSRRRSRLPRRANPVASPFCSVVSAQTGCSISRFAPCLFTASRGSRHSTTASSTRACDEESFCGIELSLYAEEKLKSG